MQFVRFALAVAYAATVCGAFFAPWSPRVLWTVLMPCVPVAVVLLGFHTWRRACPIAALGELGARWARQRRRRRPPQWLRAGASPLALAALFAALVFRLVAANGDGAILGCLLLTLPLAAIAINARYGGRTFCNRLCPVGVVERIYTDGRLGTAATSSRCQPCVGCTRSCPDIDHARAYRSELGSRSQRVVFFAFPGLVLGFYAYYYLRAGTWAAYFDGDWTERAVDVELLVGPGWFFAPDVPAILAAPVTLMLCAVVSLVTLTAVEWFLGHLGHATRSSGASQRLRHRMLAVASFSAFGLFYLFAGQPTLRLVPPGARVVAFLVPVIATVVLMQRLRATDDLAGEQPDARGARWRQLRVIAEPEAP